ncbi:MAG: sugar ABC transporter permease [Anaeromyxobacter sp.]
MAVPLEQQGADGAAADVIGAVRILVPAEPAGATPLWPLLLAILAPVAVIAAALRFLPDRAWPMFAATAVALALSLGAYFVWARGEAQDARVDAHQDVSKHVKALQAEAITISNSHGIAATAVPPGSWDAGPERRPLGYLQPNGDLDRARIDATGAEADGSVLRVIWVLAGLALFVLATVGFGGVHKVAAGFWKHRTAYGYITPAMVGVTLLVFFPFFYGVTLSFTSSDLHTVHASPFDIWIGLRNYATILGDWQVATITPAGELSLNFTNFYYTFLFTVLWTVTNVAIGVTGGLILALILNTKGLALRPIYRVVLILPWAMPNYITALIWRGMFHRQFGVVNNFLAIFGVEPLSWFDNPVTSYLTALATNGWLSFPFMMVVSLGALQSIPADIYEAARVDGATRWQQFKAITLPSLKPALVPAIILSVVWTFNMFNVIYLVTGGEPGGATDILVTQAYKYAFQQYRYGYAAAYSTIIFGILLVYGVFQNRMTKASEGI